MIRHNYDLNMNPGGVPLIVRLSQYDSDIDLVFRLFASKGNFQIEAGTTAEIRGRKADGQTFTHSGTISGNSVTIPFFDDMTDTAGKTECEISLIHNHKELSTANFFIQVEPTALDPRTPVPVFITFWNGEYLLLQMRVENGEDAVYPNDSPGRAETERYFYEFNGWSKKTDDNTPDDDALSNITKARAVYACFITHTKSRIIYYNRTVQVSEDIIIDGADAIYNGEVPTIQSTEQNTFTFAGWSFLDDNRLNVNALKHVDEPIRTVYAVFTITGPTFIVDFVYNGVTLQSSIVPYGGSAHYTSLVPEKSSTSSKDFGFAGWSLGADDNTVDEGALTNVLENRTLYPCFAVTHTRAVIAFWVGNTKVEEHLIIDGANAVYQGSTPTKASTDYEDYVFNGWSIDQDDNTPDNDALLAVSEDRDVYACFRVSHFRAYITFWNESEEIATYTITDGANAVYEEATPLKPSTANWDYGFTGWSLGQNDNTPDANALINVTTDRNVYACFEVIHTHATITFWNGNTQLRTMNIVDWGDAEYTGTEPRKTSTEYQDYEFNGWSLGQDDNTPDANALHEVITDRNVYACFRVSHFRAYVTFWNGSTELRRVTVTDGADAEYNGTEPRKTSTEYQDYEFNGWSLGSDDNTVDANALKNVTTDRNVYACFRVSHSRAYVTFWNGSTELRRVTVTDGADAEYTGSEPRKEGNANNIYTFIGWSLNSNDNTVDANALKNVTQDRNLYACFQHTTTATVTFWNGSTQLLAETVTGGPSGGTATYSGGETPTKTGGDHDEYIFTGWSLGSDDNTVDANALKNVTTDRNVYACYTHNTLTFVSFMTNNGLTMLHKATVRNGGNATYGGSTPQMAADDIDSSYTFVGWAYFKNPAVGAQSANILQNVTNDRTVYAVFKGSNEITDSWETIISYANAGTIASHYSVGRYKFLYSSRTDCMKIRYINSGYRLASNNNYANVVFCSFSSNHKHNITNYSVDVETDDGWEKTYLRTMLNENALSLTAVEDAAKEVKVPYVKKVYAGTGYGGAYYETAQGECIDKVWLPTYNDVKDVVAYSRRYDKRWIRDLDYWVQYYWTYYDYSGLNMDKATVDNYYDFMFAL